MSQIKKFEEVPLLGDNTDNFTGQRSRRKLFVLVSIVLIGLVFFIIANGTSRQFFRLSDLQDELVFSNSYERFKGRSIGDGIYPYERLVSTNLKTKLSLLSEENAEWSIIEPISSVEIKIAKGKTTHYTFEKVGQYIVKTLRLSDSVEFTFNVDARITRFEIRDLSVEDRNKYFATLKTYYQTSEEEGKKMYGDQFSSWSVLLRLFLYGTGSKDCDHWLNGPGLINHQTSLTLIFEQSLRMISNDAAAHYWDYTLTDKTEVFTDDWFGPSHSSNTDQIVDSGLWAYTPLISDPDKAFSDIVNPYGLLRAPWNTNPTPYLVRYDNNLFGDTLSLPTCTDFAANLDSSFAELSAAVNKDLAGRVYRTVGGYVNKKASKNKLKITSKNTVWASEYAENDLAVSKSLWRQGYVRIPDSCSSDTKAKQCMPSCPSSSNQGGSLSAEKILSQSGGFAEIVNWYNVYELVLSDSIKGKVTITDDDLLNEICEVGYSGELLSATAPQDPVFWSIHGNIEKLFYTKQYYHNNKITDEDNNMISFDSNWDYNSDSNDPNSNVYDWSNVETITDMPINVELNQGMFCTGHNLNDLLPLHNFIMADGIVLEQYLTNSEFFNMLSYENSNLPYVYDRVTTWESCFNQNLIAEKAKNVPKNES